MRKQECRVIPFALRSLSVLACGCEHVWVGGGGFLMSITCQSGIKEGMNAR